MHFAFLLALRCLFTRIFYGVRVIVNKKNISCIMLLKKANELLSQNKLREAEFHFKTLLQSEPDNGDALFGLGKVQPTKPSNATTDATANKYPDRQPSN